MREILNCAARLRFVLGIESIPIRLSGKPSFLHQLAGTLAVGETTTQQSCDSWACAFTHVYDHGGMPVLALFSVFFLFYKLIWKVWLAMITSKDAEIDRLTKERNFYQEKLFPDRSTSDIQLPVARGKRTNTSI
jgi:hypothetical protein